MLPARSIAACGSDYRFCPQDRAERTTFSAGIVQDARLELVQHAVPAALGVAHRRGGARRLARLRAALDQARDRARRGELGLGLPAVALAYVHPAGHAPAPTCRACPPAPRLPAAPLAHTSLRGPAAAGPCTRVPRVPARRAGSEPRRHRGESGSRGRLSRAQSLPAPPAT